MINASNKRKLTAIISEIQARGLDLPEDVRQSLLGVKPKIIWPVNEYGCFTKKDGTSFIPNDRQAPFIFSDARFSGLVSGRGGGKTCSGAQKALGKIMQGESGAVLNQDCIHFILRNSSLG